MSLEHTQHQSQEQRTKARELSLEPTRPPSDVPGYKLLTFLGSGAYGEVWSASDLKTGRNVAIKFYTRRSTADVQLLAREVEKLVVLAADRYVVQLLDVGWDADPPYYVMDYIEHGSLEDRIKEKTSVSTTEAIELFQEIATGMMHLHGKGILHCDLKPGNVLLDQDGKPRLADFGQSRLHTEETSALGTLFYMAPEQADLDAIPDARWDVYGLGALFYCMLTGKPPYYSSQLANQVETSEDICDRLITYREGLKSAPQPTAHRSVPGVDRALADIIDQCIEVDPKKRFNNIQSLLLALRQREMVRARRPLMLLGLLAPLILIGGMSLFGWWAFRQSVDQTQNAITKKAGESNAFAAKLAARSAAEQIDEYFRVVGQLSRNEDFLAAYDKFILDERLTEIRETISDPYLNAASTLSGEDQLRDIRQEFRNHPLRTEMQKYLKERLFDRTGEFPLAASWFVNDRYGNQVASAFRSENKTLGNNYSYRSYFSGLQNDLKTKSSGKISFQVAKHPEQRQIIDRPRLSAAFISQQSNGWKVAFSAPIRRPGEDVVLGIVAVSVDLGNFIEFDQVKKHYAMMVDTRADVNNVIILEHPLFEETLRSIGRVPDELASCRIDFATIGDKEIFHDPIAGSKIGQESNYHLESIVAVAPITIQNRSAKTNSTNIDAEPEKTGLFILAVQDYQGIVEPANSLSKRLGQLAIFAAIFLLIVSVGMWLFVYRLLSESKQRLERAFSRSADSSSLPDSGSVNASGKLT